MDKFKILDHPSDIGAEAYGKDLTEALENIALAMFSIMYDVNKVEERITIPFAVEAEDREKLLVDFLSEALYTVDSKKMVFARCQILDFSGTEISGSLYGEAVDLSRHQFYHYVKAVTYSQLEIEEKEDHCRIKVIFDI